MDECYVGSQQLSQETDFAYETFAMKQLRENSGFVFNATFHMTKQEVWQRCGIKDEPEWMCFKEALIDMGCTCKDDTLIYGVHFEPLKEIDTGQVVRKLTFLNACRFGSNLQMPKKQLVQLCAEQGILDWHIIEAALKSVDCECDKNIVYGLTIDFALMHKTISRIKKRNALTQLSNAGLTVTRRQRKRKIKS